MIALTIDNVAHWKKLCNCVMVPPGRIELPIQSYQDCVIPFNYGGLFLSVLCSQIAHVTEEYPVITKYRILEYID